MSTLDNPNVMSQITIDQKYIPLKITRQFFYVTLHIYKKKVPQKTLVQE
jgi:hypothetical protein